MHFNFSFNKAFSDLFDNKKYAFELLYLIILMIVLNIVASFSQLKLLPTLGYLIWLGYLFLMCNNIINGKEPVLADIFSNSKGRNIFIVALKFFGLALIYGLLLAVILLILSMLFMALLSVPKNKAIIFSVIVSFPFFLFVSYFSTFLYSENLKFRDGLNLKKALLSFKLAWKDYLAVFAFLIIFYILCIVAAMPIFLVLGVLAAFMMKSSLHSNYSTISSISIVLGTIWGNSFGFVLGYFYHNILAQIYKYTLVKINDKNLS